MTIQEVREEVGMSRAELSRLLNIPVSTLEAWDYKKRKPSDWMKELVIEKIKKSSTQFYAKSENMSQQEESLFLLGVVAKGATCEKKLLEILNEENKKVYDKDAIKKIVSSISEYIIKEKKMDCRNLKPFYEVFNESEDFHFTLVEILYWIIKGIDF